MQAPGKMLTPGFWGQVTSGDLGCDARW